MMKTSLTAVLLLLTLTSTSNAWAQGLGQRRYDLSRRLQAFEKQWDKVQDKRRRQGAVGNLKSAVQSFFRFRLTGAAESLDKALQSLLALEPKNSTALTWVQSQRWQVKKRLIDVTDSSFELIMEPLYKVKVARPANLSLELSTRLLKGKTWQTVLSSPVTANKAAFKTKFQFTQEGDYVLRIRLLKDGERLQQVANLVSVVRDLKSRLGALKKVEVSLTRSRAATLKRNSGILNKLAAGKTLETDFPAFSMLRDIETWLLAKPEPLKSGQHWLSVVSDKGAVPCRVAVPAKQSKAVPLLIAVHGAGGSENMFFDTYGCGSAVEHSIKRKWIIVAPGMGFFGRLDLPSFLNELARFVKFDRERVFLMGHSMGAGVVSGCLTKNAKLIAGAALISGGGRFPKASKALKNQPVFLAAGDQDFGLAGTRGASKALKQLGARVEFKVYKGLEHLIIVQEAIPDCFRFFERCLGADGVKKPRLF